MGILSGSIGLIGSGLNSLTGATSAAKQSQKYALQSGAINNAYALQSAALNNAYQKEFAQNAHQWEIEDLKKAGLNPVLSAGGSGTGASGGGVDFGSVNSATQASAGLDPLNAGIGIWQGIEQAQNTAADTSKKNAETHNEQTRNENIKADTLLKKRQALQILIQNAHTEQDRKRIMAEIKKTDAEIENINADTKLKNITPVTKETDDTLHFGPISIGSSHKLTTR